MFSVMFAGPWLAWPWFIVNAWALGSPKRGETLITAIAGVLCSYAAFLFVVLGHDLTWVPADLVAYLWIVITALQLGICYTFYARQAQVHELFQHFGGTTRSGLLVVLLGAALKPLIQTLPPLLPLVFR